MKKDFVHFCIAVANKFGLALIPNSHDKSKMTTVRADYHGRYDYFIDFDAFGLEHGRKDYMAQLYKADGSYLGAVTQTIDPDGSEYCEHFEVAVSPWGLYQPHGTGGNPLDPDGNEINGQRWSFYEGSSLTKAVNSLKKGGSVDGRNPIRVDD